MLSSGGDRTTISTLWLGNDFDPISFLAAVERMAFSRTGKDFDLISSLEDQRFDPIFSLAERRPFSRTGKGFSQWVALTQRRREEFVVQSNCQASWKNFVQCRRVTAAGCTLVWTKSISYLSHLEILIRGAQNYNNSLLGRFIGFSFWLIRLLMRSIREAFFNLLILIWYYVIAKQ